MAVCNKDIFLYFVSLIPKYSYILLNDDPMPSTLRWAISEMPRLVMVGFSNSMLSTLQSVSFKVLPKL